MTPKPQGAQQSKAPWQQLQSLSGVTFNSDGRSFNARCPAHSDINPSLSVTVGLGGRVLLHCFAGCQTEAVVDALGMQMSDVFADGGSCRTDQAIPVRKPRSPTPRAKNKKSLDGPRRVSVSFDYLTRMGDWLYAIDRWEGGGKPKSFIAWPKGLRKEDRLLYRMNELSDGDDPVLIPEGEGKTDILVNLGYTATACPFGASAWLPHYADSLRHRDVVVWPDKDEAGKKFAEDVVRSLRARQETSE